MIVQTLLVEALLYSLEAWIPVSMGHLKSRLDTFVEEVGQNLHRSAQQGFFQWFLGALSCFACVCVHVLVTHTNEKSVFVRSEEKMVREF